MVLNPFFDLSWAMSGSTLALHDFSLIGIDEDDDDVSSGSGSGSSRSSNTSLENDYDEKRSNSLPENVKLVENKK